MFFKKNNPSLQYYGINQSNNGKKITVLASLMIFFLAALLVSSLFSNKQNKSANVLNGANRYSTLDFSINLPDQFEEVSNELGVVTFKSSSAEGNSSTKSSSTGTITVGRYLQNKDPDSIFNKVKALSTTDSAGEQIRDISIEETNINKDRVLIVKSSNHTKYYIFRPDYVWKLEFSSENKDSTLLGISREIALTFKTN